MWWVATATFFADGDVLLAASNNINIAQTVYSRQLTMSLDGQKTEYQNEWDKV